MLSTLLGGSRD